MDKTKLTYLTLYFNQHPSILLPAHGWRTTLSFLHFFYYEKQKKKSLNLRRIRLVTNTHPNRTYKYYEEWKTSTEQYLYMLKKSLCTDKKTWPRTRPWGAAISAEIQHLRSYNKLTCPYFSFSWPPLSPPHRNHLDMTGKSWVTETASRLPFMSPSL